MDMQLRESDFVHRIVKDPDDPPDTLLLVGFVGRSNVETQTRIYLDVMLASYVDVPTDSILHAQDVPAAQSPLGGHYIWVLRDHDVVQRVREAREEMTKAQQEFMSDFDGGGTSSLSSVAPGWPTIPT